MATLNREFTPNIYIDLGNGMVKANCLAETFVPFTTDGSTDPLYNESGGTVKETDYFCPVRGMEMKPERGFNVKVDTVTTFNALKYYQGLGVKSPVKIDANLYESDELKDAVSALSEDYRTQILCMPMYAPIRNGDKVIEAQKAIIDGSKSTIIVKANREYGEVLDKFLDGKNNDDNSKYLAKYSLVLCADPRVFNPYAYSIYTDDVGKFLKFTPEGYQDDIEDYSENGNMNDIKLPYAKKGYFVVNGEYTKFLMLIPGSIVKLTSYYEEVKTKNGIENVLLWNVDNSSSFSRVEGEVDITGIWGYSTSSKKLDYIEQSDVISRFGVKKFSDGTTSREVFISNMLKKVFDNATSIYVGVQKRFSVKIELYSALKEYWEDSIKYTIIDLFEE